MEAIWTILLSFFAAYGIVEMIAGIICWSRKRRCKGAHSYRVMVLKDCQDSVEGLIRSMGWEDIGDDLIVVDMDSQDETPWILKKMEQELDFLYVMTPEEYGDYHGKVLSRCMD